MENKIYLTTKETAEYFEVSQPTILNWTKRGILHPKRVGRKWYFKKKEVYNLLPKNKKDE